MAAPGMAIPFDLERSAADLRSELELLERIRQEGEKFVLFSQDGKKRLGEYPSREAALKRERQVAYFKQAKEEKDHPLKQAVAIGYSETGEGK